jgi:fibronectin type 3 domain-containing protein
VSVALSGTGSTVQHSVAVNWTASTSTVAGYNVYRGTLSGGPYSKIDSTLITGLTYTDNTVSSGATYYYVITAVAADGTESSFSNQVQAVIPTP